MKKLYKILFFSSVIIIGLGIVFRNYFIFGNPCFRCNIILIALDPLNVSHLSYFGYEKTTSPSLDDLAKRSIVFTRAYSTSSWSIPSYMSLFTGMYPTFHTLTNTYSTYQSNSEYSYMTISDQSKTIHTLTEELKNNGYRTGGFVGSPSLRKDHGFDRGFDYYEGGNEYRSIKESGEKALSWLNEQSDKPFFLFIHGSDLDGNLALPGSLKELSPDAAGYKGSLTGSVDEYQTLIKESYIRHSPLLYSTLPNTVIEQYNDQLTHQYHPNHEDVGFLNAVYDTKLKTADTEVSQFLSGISKVQSTHDTIIVFTSSNGTSLFEDDYFGYGLHLRENIIHVPLLITYPKMTKPTTITNNVSLIDIPSTLLYLVGIRPSPQFQKQQQGINILAKNTLTGSKDRMLFFETDYTRSLHLRGLLTSDNWKYVLTMETGERQLHNISADPNEETSLYLSEIERTIDMEQMLRDRFFKTHPFSSNSWGTTCIPETEQVCSKLIQIQ